MKIVGFHIEGFGVFRDYGVSELGDGVTLFFGLNEAGKSTLLDFIRCTLFGYPRRSKGAYPREPLHGGRHGGRIEIVTDDGRTVTMECFAGETPRVRGAGGPPRAADLPAGMSRETFAAYYAFDLDDLADERSQLPGELESALLDAGQAGQLRSPKSVHEQLKREMDELYKKSGRNQPIVKALADLQDLRHAIAQCRQRPREYEEKRRAFEELEDRLRAVRERKERFRVLLDRVQQLHDVRPLYFAWREATEAAKRAEAVENFPADGVARLEQLDERVAQLGGEIERKKAEIAHLEGRRSARAADRQWLDRAPAIEQLARERSAHEQRRQRIAKMETDRAALERRAENDLKRLGEGWTAEKVRAVAGDLLAEDCLRGPLEHIRRTQQNLAIEEKELGDARNSLQRIETQLEEQRRAIEGQAARKPDEVDAQIAALNGWLELDGERRRAAERLADLERQMARAGADLEETDQRAQLILASRVSRSHWIAAALGLVMLAAAPVAWMAGEGALAVALGAFALLAVGTAVWARTANLRRNAEKKDELGRIEKRLQDMRSEIEPIRAEHQRLHEAIGQLERQQEELAGRAELAPPADRATVVEARRRAEEERGRAVERASARGQLTQIENQAAEARARTDSRGQRVETLQAELEAARADLRAALGAVGLPQTLSPETALEAFGLIRSLQQTYAELDRLGAETEPERRAIATFADQVFALSQALSVKVAGADWPSALDELERRLAEEKRASEEERAVEGQIDTARHEIELLDKERLRGAQERAALLQAGGAANDPEQFRRRAQAAQSYAEALAHLNEARAKLDAHRPPRQSPKQFFEELEKADWRSIDSQMEKLTSDWEEARQEHHEFLQEHGRLENEIHTMERAEELFDLRQQEEATRAQLAETARRWNVLALADALMVEVQQIYERERQPWRLRRASELFRQFTRGRFERVHVDDEAKQVVAVRAKTLEALAAEQLSRGTRDQLYLALRLALVDELAASPRKIVLPLIFDDILVNFDDARARATAEALVEIARGRQLWYFTAHESTRQLLREVGIAAEVPLETFA